MKNMFIIDRHPCGWRDLQKELVFDGHRVAYAPDIESLKRLMNLTIPNLLLICMRDGIDRKWNLFHSIRQQWPGMPLLMVAPDDIADRKRLRQAIAEVIGPAQTTWGSNVTVRKRRFNQ